MTLLRHFLLAALAFTTLLHGEPGQPPPAIVLPDTLATTATGRTIDGKPWTYLVVLPSDPASIAGKRFRIHLKPAAIAAAGNFSPIGEIQPVTDPTTLAVLIQRGIALGDDSKTVREIIDSLVADWAPGSLDLPDEPHHRLAALIHRGASSESDAATLRALSLAHPVFRLALGLAWGGPIPVPAGTTCTIEVREVAPDGMDLAVVGRCEFIAGQPAALTAPSAPVQLPDLTAEGDLTIKLRWGVPTPLRRQALQTTGFRVWRVPSAASLPNPPTLAQLTATPGIKQITIAPILLTKLFTSGNPATATDAANFSTDPTTFFTADNNGRDEFINTQTVRGAPPILQPTGTPHIENTTYQYYVAALDWLKQPGPLSTAGNGVAVRTLPPPIPSNLLVEEKHLGGTATNIRLQLSFDPNPNVPGATPTERYAIYRGDSGPQSLERRNYLLPRPELPLPPAETGLSALATLNHQPTRLSFTDNALPAAANQATTFWYAIRAIHDTPLGPVYSAPSPPVFGTFHDYRGPNAPTGTLHTDPLRALCREATASYIASEALPATAIVPFKGRIIRLVARRLDPEITTVQFIAIDPRTANTGSGPRIVFAPGQDEVFFDAFFADPTGNPNVPTQVVFAAACLARNGSASYIAWRQLGWGTGGIAASATQRTRITFECASSPTSQLATTGTFGSKMLETPPNPVFAFEQTTVRATFPTTTYDGRTAIITTLRGVTSRQAVKVKGSTLTFADPGRLPGAPAATHTFRIVRPFQPHGGSNPSADQLPPAWPVAITWPPPPPETEHVTGDLANTLSVALTLTPESKEYQVHRQVDAAPMTLIAEGIADHETHALQEIVVADRPNLPASGRICYFARLVDRHGNASPLAQIGPCIDLIAPTPIPVLNDPKPAGTSAAPKMQLSWFCPPQGVRRFRIRLVDLTSGTESVSSPGATQLPVDANHPVYFNPSPAGVAPTSLAQGTSFATHLQAPLNEAADPPSTHTAEFNIQADHEYHVEVEAVGLNPDDRQRSLPRKFVWRSPVASGAVAWPARPLPKVVDGIPLNLQARELHPGNPYFASCYASPLQPFDAESTPVLVPLALLPVTANGFSSSRSGTVPEIQVGSFPLLTPDTASPLYRGSIDPNAHLLSIPSAASTSQLVPLLPVVIYRQVVAAQGLNTTNTGELVQCSPMVTRIAWRNNAPSCAIVDPLIVTLPAYSSGNFTSASLWLPDTKPVVAGSTYRYFLVRFATDGEIEQVIDCGTVTITP
jgi:hypothetical protein